MQRQPSDFLTFDLKRLMSKQRSLITAMTILACDVEGAFSRTWRVTAKNVNSSFAGV